MKKEIQNWVFQFCQFLIFASSQLKSVKFSWIIKILTHPFFEALKFNWFQWGWSKKKLWENKFKMADSKNWVFQFRQYVFSKTSWIGPWVSRIDWCKGHWCGSTYMVERLSNVSSKTGKKCIFCVFRPFLSLTTR